MVERIRSAADGAGAGDRPRDAGTDASTARAGTHPASPRSSAPPDDAAPAGGRREDAAQAGGHPVDVRASGELSPAQPSTGVRPLDGQASDDRRGSGHAPAERSSSGQDPGDQPSPDHAPGGHPHDDSPSASHADPGTDFAHGIEDDVQPLQAGVDTGAGACPGAQLRHLSSPEGQAALVALMRGSVLFAFDFDGTLAPIRPRPGDVHVSATLALRLEKLARLRPVAIVTGRQIDDVRGRLGFTPTWIVGNHGAEDDGDPDAARRAAQALDPLRRRLESRADGLQDAGVAIEDKGQSLALHFRTAPDRDAARALIDEVLAGFTPHLHVFGGKLVVNAVAADAPDKAVAVRRLLARSGAQNAFFAGDDVNDEPVFAAAQPGWLTVRIGCDRRGTSAARFCIDGPHEMAVVLDRLLALADGGG